jgi:hypothetical protein
MKKCNVKTRTKQMPSPTLLRLACASVCKNDSMQLNLWKSFCGAGKKWYICGLRFFAQKA